MIGAGTWADAEVAVSCAGSGEAFLRTAAAAQIAWRRGAGAPLAAAAAELLERIRTLGGEGGVAAVDRDGAIALPFNAEGMKRAWLTRDGEIGAAVSIDGAERPAAASRSARVGEVGRAEAQRDQLGNTVRLHRCRRHWPTITSRSRPPKHGPPRDRLAAAAAGGDGRGTGERAVRADMAAGDRDPGDLVQPERLRAAVSAEISAQTPSR